MSSRKRKRRRRRRRPPDEAGEAGARPTTEKPPPRRPRRGEPAERPAPPWGSFPLSELAIFVGAVLLVVGFLAASGSRQATLVVAGFAIASIGALEVAVREHFAGYRSHTLLLAGVPAVIALGALFFAGPDSLGPPVRVLIGGGVYAAAAWALMRAFRARSGGYAFRAKAPRR
ncbi:MAG TPA: hypothetical protein VK919_13225 [Solirubrobacterales bacterium]|nr:hypothetical protein [Solirubrobacterales bacterium]